MVPTLLSIETASYGGKLMRKTITSEPKGKSRFTLRLLGLVLVLSSCSSMFGQATAGQSFVEFKLNGLGSILIPDIMELQSG